MILARPAICAVISLFCFANVIYIYQRYSSSGLPIYPRSRAFYVYIPPRTEYIDELYGFLESWRFVFDVREEASSEALCPTNFLGNFTNTPSPIPVNDVIVGIDYSLRLNELPFYCETLVAHSTGPARDRLQIGKRIRGGGGAKCFVVQVNTPTSSQNEWDVHPPINSLSSLVDPVVSSLLSEYDLMMRTDADCFLLPGLNDPINIPTDGRLFSGRGGYQSSTTDKLLPLYSRATGLRHQGISAVGATVYGPPNVIIDSIRAGLKVGLFWLQNDPVFIGGEGLWPNWYKGVASMYVGEQGLNHVLDREKYSRVLIMDAGPTTNDSIWDSTNAIHLHCWHSREFFSKFDFRDGAYSEDIFRWANFTISHRNCFAFGCAWNGAWRRAQNTINAQSVLSASGVEELQGWL